MRTSGRQSPSRSKIRATLSATKSTSPQGATPLLNRHVPYIQPGASPRAAPTTAPHQSPERSTTELRRFLIALLSGVRGLRLKRSFSEEHDAVLLVVIGHRRKGGISKARV